MIDPHRTFTDWVIDGAPGEPPRVVAVHASACPECRALIEAFDALSRINIDAAPMPAISAAARRPRLAASAIARRSAAVAAAALLVATAAVAFSNGVLLIGSQPTPRPAGTEGVLGGTPSATTRATATPTAGSSLPSSASPSASAQDVEPTAAASVVAPPPPPPVAATPQPPIVSSPRPTVPATPAPTVVGPSPTPRPTPRVSPPATPSPTPEPSPTPVPAQCADGADNDGDSFVDFPQDPECVSLEDDDESVP